MEVFALPVLARTLVYAPLDHVLVLGDDGVTRMVRSCTDGPVFFGDRVRWADVGTVPAGTLGAPEPRDD